MNHRSTRTAREATLDFLRHCLCSRWDPTALAAAEELSGNLDGETVGRVAHEQGVAPLLYSIVRGQHLVPPAVEQELRRAYYAAARDGLFLFRELAAVLRTLVGAGLEVMLLKGAALACAVYGNLALRPMSDVDLLIHQQDVPAALRLLAKEGYAPAQPDPFPNASLRYASEVGLHRAKPPGVPLEVHWGLFNLPSYQYDFPVEWFWQSSLPTTLEGMTVQMLGPEAQVIYLCAHAVFHHGPAPAPRLLWLHDVAEVVAHYQDRLDWGLALTQAQACHLVSALQRILPQLAGEWHAPIPGVALGQLSTLQPTRREEQALSRGAAVHNSPARLFWLHLTSIRGWRQRLHLACRSLFPSAGYMRERYHIPHMVLLPLYYPYRWLLGLRSALVPSGRREAPAPSPSSRGPSSPPAHR